MGRPHVTLYFARRHHFVRHHRGLAGNACRLLRAARHVDHATDGYPPGVSGDHCRAHDHCHSRQWVNNVVIAIAVYHIPQYARLAQGLTLSVKQSTFVEAAITTAAGLSFLGLGVPPPTAEWGSMLQNSLQWASLAPHVMVVPGLALMLVVFGFNVMGDGLRDAMDPRLNTSRRGIRTNALMRAARHVGPAATPAVAAPAAR